jgi:hypothetical protein
VVSSGGPSPSAIPRSSLVSPQGRTVVRRHAHHPAAAELAGQNPHTALENCTFRKPAASGRIGQS